MSTKRARVHPESSSSGVPSALGNLARAFAEVLKLRKPAFVYHTDSKEDRVALIDELWTGDYLHAIGRFSGANLHLVDLFEQQKILELDEVTSAATVRRPEGLQSRSPRFESVISGLFRSRSQKCVTLETAALSVRFLHYRVPVPVWGAVAFFSPLVMSRQWTEQLCDEALARNPGCPYKATESGLSAACFDNFSIKVGYGSYATVDRKGERFDMTNWCWASIAANAVPPNLDLRSMVRSTGIFRDELVLDEFVDLFAMKNASIVSNQQRRWIRYLDAAARQDFDVKPTFTSPYPPTHFEWKDPILDRLQSSYEDVNFEIDHIRKHAPEGTLAIQLGMDGLSFQRTISRLAQSPRFYLRKFPIIIPRLGEHPHGTYHVLHGDWRIWWPLIEKAAVVVNNKQVKTDPNVSDFNESEHFIRILTRACSLYVLEISRTGSSYRLAAHFLNAADHNLSFAYICQFLYLNAFKFKQMRDSVRTNDSKTLDLIWRENLASARAAKKHNAAGEATSAGKTNYALMSVVLIYWGVALLEPLQTAFHNTRTVRWVHSHVGWDMVIEMLNLLVKQSVVANITHDLIRKFIRRLNFTWVVHRALEAILKENRQRDEATLKDIDADVQLLLEWLRTSIGTTYAEATKPSDDNLLNLDMSRWGGDRTPANRRNGAPWKQRERAMVDYRTYVRGKLAMYCPWAMWQ
jgi:hypothetical protein